MDCKIEQAPAGAKPEQAGAGADAEAFHFSLPVFGEGEGGVCFTRFVQRKKNPTPALPEDGEGERRSVSRM